MREVAPGDIIFSFRDTRIAALGIARSNCYESPKPTEFGTAGSYWEAIGWKIDVSFRELDNRIHPKSHIGELRGLLPEKYSPLRANGDGLQSVYLTEVGRPFAAALFRLIGDEANKVADVAKEVDRAEQLSPSREPDLERSEERVEQNIREDPKIPDTQREAMVQPRAGEGEDSPVQTSLVLVCTLRDRVTWCKARTCEGQRPGDLR
jgi:putative restriction endonuclease